MKPGEPKPSGKGAAKSARSQPDERAGLTALLNPTQMHKLGRLVLLSRYVVEGNLAGAHRSPLHGPSSEFADHKAYGQGDDPKHIDWRVLGRTEKYYVKRFEDETNLRVFLALDRSASMAYGSGEVTKYDFACRLAAALGYVVVKSRDSVGLFLFSDKVDAKLEASNSLQHLDNAMRTIQERPPVAETKTGLAGALHEIAGSVRRRGLVVVISDLLDDEEAVRIALAHLHKQHHDIILFHVLDPAEIDLSLKRACELTDLETGERMAIDPRALAADYRRVFGEFLERYRKTCASMNIDYRLVPTSSEVESYVRAYLLERRRLSK